MAKRGTPIIEVLESGDTASGLAQFVQTTAGDVQVQTPSGVQTIATSQTVASAVSARLKKVQLTGTGAVPITSTAHADAEVHINTGITSVTMAVAAWTPTAPNILITELYNDTTVSIPVTISGFSGGISLDGDVANDIGGTGTLITIGVNQSAQIYADADGWTRASFLGSEVTQAELNAVITVLDKKASKAIITDRDTVTNGLSGRLIHLRSDALAAGAVAAWSDESGAGNNFTGTGTAQPTATAAAIGTHMAVRFDGTNDVVSRSSVNLGTDWTIAALVRTGASLTGQILSDNYPSAVSYMLGLNTASFLGGTANAICVGGFSGVWAGARAAAAAAVNTVYLIIATRTQGGNYVLRVNGVQEATGAAGTNPTFESGGTLYLGKRWDTSASEFWTGDIGEIQMFNRVLTTEETQITEGMLAWKYGQQALLPSTHTYSTDAPAIVNVPVPASSLSTATTSANGLMSSTDKTKLDGVATGAEVNVQSDWNATTGDAQILNKPTSMAPTTHTHAQADVTSLATDLAAKQATLVSGTNIKTVGGVTVLGTGDVPFPTFATSLRLMTPTDIIEDTDRAVYLTADGLAAGALATWANPGTGGDFAQVTGTAQPTVTTLASLGGRNVVQFDGTTDFMDTANISLGTRYGLFAVFVPAALGNQYLLSEVYSSSTVEYTFGIEGGKFLVGHFNGAWRNYLPVSPAPVANTPYIIVAGYDGSNLSIKIDGATAVTSAQTSDPTLTEAANIRLGRRWDGTVDFFNGHIACVVAKRNAYFTATEIAQLEGFAAWHYGRVASLPTGHTYKNSPPLITA